jgi:hypothetical protein
MVKNRVTFSKKINYWYTKRTKLHKKIRSIHKNPFQGLEGKPVESNTMLKISQRIGLA